MPLAYDGVASLAAICWMQNINFRQIRRREGSKIVVCRWHTTMLILRRQFVGTVSKLSHAAGKWRFLFFAGEPLDAKEQVERDASPLIISELSFAAGK